MIERVLYDLAEGRGPDEVCPEPEALREAMEAVMQGKVKETELAAMLMGLRCRGERPEHLEVVIGVLKENAVPFPFEDDVDLYDTCGTGGDAIGTVNISTAAALLAAAAGLPVAKHGNRSVSSKSGSADVIEALGIRLDVPPDLSVAMLKEHNFCFLLAPHYHPAMKHAGPTRRDIKIRSIFNLAGPLANPARITRQLVGVAERRLVEVMAETLRVLGRTRALVVHGRNGEDEISLTQVTEGLHLRADGELESFYLDPGHLGLEVVEMADLVVEGPQESAARIRQVLAGEQGAITDVINLNFAAVLLLADMADTMDTAFINAREIQESGAGLRLLEKLIEKSNSA